ncbi:MAG: transglutaminase domain-containing protein [Bacteroidota bacterium]|nr:transglutaminase domain-containing protein [Bacteroidota bacterium]
MRPSVIVPLVALFGLSGLVMAQQAPRGMTEKIPLPESFICSGQAEPVPPSRAVEAAVAPGIKESSHMDEWRVVDSVLLDTYVLPLGYAGVRFDIAAQRLETLNSIPDLTTTARSAVDLSPQWLRADLHLTLSALPAARQNELANVILSAPERMIDEVAFAIAHSSPAFLRSAYCFPQLFRENAELIYANDQYLPYVEVVDFGTVASGDYYSTLRYRRTLSDGNSEEVEIPRDIYYWYVVHPKLTDEVAAYIDPTAADGLSAVKAPPQGRFWREYLFTVTEPVPDTTGVDFPVLRDMVSGCHSLWDDRPGETSAVLQVGKWIRDVLDFGSKTERPHQPVRIYKLHLGRCGEHADITGAAARACLIPCREVSAISSDHVWNEFWDLQWWQWEPVNNSQKNPLVYSEGWGKKFGTVMARRSDGVFTPVTDVYARETCTLEIQVKDANSKPVDGALVMIAMRVDQNIYIDTYGVTGSDGIARFILGKGNDYFARFDSPNAGSYPAQSNQVAQLMTNAQPGQHYAYLLKGTVAKPSLSITTDTNPLQDAIPDFGVQMEGTLIAQATRWVQPIDDIRTVEPCTFYEEGGSGMLDISYLQQEGFAALRAKQPFRRFNGGITDLSSPCVFNTANMDLDATQDAYLLFINKNNANNPVRVKATARLYVSTVVGAERNPSADAEFAVLSCHPSPVTGDRALLTLSVPPHAGSSLTILVHDPLGRTVRTQHVSVPGFGSQTMLLDTRGLPQGFYLLDIRGRDGSQAHRIIGIR